MQTALVLNEIARRCHDANINWWRDIETGKPKDRNVGELIALCHSELSEALEGHRKRLPDDKLPHRPMIEVELADCLIRIFDMADGLGLDIGGAFERYSVLTIPGLPQGTFAKLELLASHFNVGASPFEGNVGDRIAECHSHLSESYVGYRSNLKILVVNNLAKTVKAILQLSGELHLDIGGAFEEKMRYNTSRADHKIENRKAEGGKKY